MRVHRDQIVFMGGLPSNICRSDLVRELEEQNVTNFLPSRWIFAFVEFKIGTLNFPIVLDKFTPRVVLETKEIAQKLIKKKRVNFKTCTVRYMLNCSPKNRFAEILGFGGLILGLRIDLLKFVFIFSIGTIFTSNYFKIFQSRPVSSSRFSQI